MENLDNEELVRCFEAVIFASGEPIAADRLAQIFELDETRTEEICDMLAQRLDQTGSALRLVRTAGQYQLCTRSEYGAYIRTALEMRRNTPLSNAAMETLAIIAYNEPVTRNIIEKVRGVDSSGVVSSLITKGLIEEKGRLDLPGRPMQYQTTTLFLRTFGIESLAELPPLPEFGADGAPDDISDGISEDVPGTEGSADTDKANELADTDIENAADTNANPGQEMNDAPDGIDSQKMLGDDNVGDEE